MRDELKFFLSEIIYPKKCVTCGTVLDMVPWKNIIAGMGTERLCGSCRQHVKYADMPICLKCGKQIESETEEYCEDCRKNKHIYDRGVAVFQYGDKIRKSIHRFKYNNCRIYGSFYGDEMYKRYGKLIREWQPDAIIPVPIHSDKLKIRGYNQAEIIAERLSKLVGIPMDKYLLVREKATIPQKELSRKNRRKNVENAFKITANVVEYKKVIVVDDIYTTGCTIDECARTLKMFNIEKVYFISICIGQGI